MWANARNVCSYSTEVRDNTFWKVVNEVKQKCSCIKQKCWKQMKKNGKLKNCGKIYRLVSKNGKMYEKKLRNVKIFQKQTHNPQGLNKISQKKIVKKKT